MTKAEVATNKHTRKIKLYEKDNPHFYNTNADDDSMKSCELLYQVRCLDLATGLSSLPKNKIAGVVVDTVYQMDHFDSESEAYTSTKELEDFLTQFKDFNAATPHYTVVVFCAALQVNEFHTVMGGLFTKVERRYWYKPNKTYKMPRAEAVTSSLEFFLIAFQKPSEKVPYATWQHNFLHENTSNVFEFDEVSQGVVLNGKVC